MEAQTGRPRPSSVDPYAAWCGIIDSSRSMCGHGSTKPAGTDSVECSFFGFPDSEHHDIMPYDSASTGESEDIPQPGLQLRLAPNFTTAVLDSVSTALSTQSDETLGRSDRRLG